MLRRLSGSYSLIAPSQKTIEAEVGLGFESCAYWYLERVDTLYGRVLMIWSSSQACADGAKVSPFDTGGLWHRHLTVRPPLNALFEMSDYVTLNTLNFSEAHKIFIEWREGAFGSAFEYVSGASRPYYLLHDRMPPEVNAPFAWSWEVRVPRINLPSDDMVLRHMFWAEGDFLDFRSYILDTLRPDQFDMALSLLATVSSRFPTLNMATQEARALVSSGPQK